MFCWSVEVSSCTVWQQLHQVIILGLISHIPPLFDSFLYLEGRSWDPETSCNVNTGCFVWCWSVKLRTTTHITVTKQITHQSHVIVLWYVYHYNSRNIKFYNINFLCFVYLNNISFQQASTTTSIHKHSFVHYTNWQRNLCFTMN